MTCKSQPFKVVFGLIEFGEETIKGSRKIEWVQRFRYIYLFIHNFFSKSLMQRLIDLTAQI